MGRTRRISGALGVRNIRRALVATLIGALALAVFAGARSVGDAHAATVCTKHTKRVVRHVRRHGQRKKIVRMQPYWTCQEVAEPIAAPVTPAPTAPAPAPTPAPTPEPEPNAVSITTNDHTSPYGYAPSRSTVKAGRLTVQLNNLASEDEHNMNVQRINAKGEPEGAVVAAVSAGAESATDPTTIEVQPGTYRMWCTIGHHAEHGMSTTITVE